MPFPPGTDEMGFDFESSINRQVWTIDMLVFNVQPDRPLQRVLEEQITAHTHTIGLVSGELDVETSLLEQEKAELHALEKDVAALDETDRNQKGRLHPFAQDAGPNKSRTSLADYELHSTIKTPPAMQFHAESDPEASEVLKQLRHHLDSMQVDDPNDIATALSTSQTALDVFNWRHLREAEYHQVYEVNTA